jgi:hypothetical protein
MKSNALLAPRAWCNPSRSAASAGYILSLTLKAHYLQKWRQPKRILYSSDTTKSGFQTHFITISMCSPRVQSAAGIAHAGSKRPGVHC